MNIFEQFANKSNEVAATNSMPITNKEEDESIDLIDDGEGNLMMHIPQDPAKIVEENKAKAEESKKKEEEKDKKKGKKDKLDVKSLKEKEPTKTKNELIEESLSQYPKIIVKVFGEKLYEYDNPDEIKMLKIDDITNLLVVEHDYEEFANGVVWNVSSNADKTIGYLIPTYKFQSKG